MRLFLFFDGIFLYREDLKIYQKILELINIFRILGRYEVKIQKMIGFLYIYNEYFEVEIGKKILFFLV